MNAIRHILAPLSCLILLTACASEPVNKPVEATHAGSGAENAALRKMVGCGSEEVLVCVEASCKPENYTCTAKSDIRRMFGNGNRPY